MRCLNPSCRRNGLPTGSKQCEHCGAIMSFFLRDMLPPGSMLHDQRYSIDYPLGRGGFGITYRAFDTKLERVVVIKEFFPGEQAMRNGKSGTVAVTAAQRDSYQRALNYFLEEARILASINKENVVRVWDYFSSHNTAYIVMQMVDGSTIRELLAQQPERRFTKAEVEWIVDQMVEALTAIHERHVYHLDISPDNVLQTDERKIVLIDFGAARQSLRTNEHYSGGRPHQYKLAYAPPEVMGNAKIGPQADLFELGMMAHELLTSTLPPSVPQRAATRDTWRPSLTDERWQKLLTQALHLDADMRPASVKDWWALYRRPGIVFGPPSPKKKMVIGPRVKAHQSRTRIGKRN